MPLSSCGSEYGRGAGVLDLPIPKIYGNRYLEPPITAAVLSALPGDGLFQYHVRIPSTYRPPDSVPLQCLVQDMLTHLCVIDVMEP
ncbi:MAG: hypothetical protein ABIK28_07675 [Planctomycetota bacterium]